MARPIGIFKYNTLFDDYHYFSAISSPRRNAKRGSATSPRRMAADTGQAAAGRGVGRHNTRIKTAFRARLMALSFHERRVRTQHARVKPTFTAHGYAPADAATD